MDQSTNELLKHKLKIHQIMGQLVNKYFTLFTELDRVISPQTYQQEADSVLGLQPEWASYRQMQDRGIAFAAGVNATF